MAKLGDPPPEFQRPQAHHDLPWKFREWFAGEGRGLNVNDTQFGRWVEGGVHQSWSRAYNNAWETFIQGNQSAGRSQVLQFLTQLLKSGMFPSN
jgi:hypothetical protein